MITNHPMTYSPDTFHSCLWWQLKQVLSSASGRAPLSPPLPCCWALSAVTESRDPSVLVSWCWGSHAALSCSMHTCGFVFFLLLCIYAVSFLSLIACFSGMWQALQCCSSAGYSPKPAAVARFWHACGTIAYTVCVLSCSSEKSLTILHQ